MCVNLSHLHESLLDRNQTQSIAVHRKKTIEKPHFLNEIKAQASKYSMLDEERFALYYEDAYPLSVTLFALLYSGKEVWLAGNNKTATAEQLVERGCLLLGDWSTKEVDLKSNVSTHFTLKPVNPEKQKITLFTSGSTGQPKVIKKSLQQFQVELETLESYWGKRLGEAVVLATVSHQHIYGLLFRVLWPLATGRCFHSETFLSPEVLLKQAKGISAYWVASPAQLKRLDELTGWSEVAQLTTIFSSGGVLPVETTNKIARQSGHIVIEVYGSSETGGIAWRQSIDNERWTTFDGISVLEDGNKTYLFSPYLLEKQTILDDRIEWLDDHHFNLLGRVDRVVKVEEKRLSLDELEQNLNASEWVEDSTSVLITGRRDKIGVAIELTGSGRELLNRQGRRELIKQLRRYMMHSLETVVLPRKWLFMDCVPMTTQGKIDRSLLTQLLSLKSTHFPQILYCAFHEQTVILQLRAQSGLVYFSGHFPDQPILPGVAQLAWVERFGKLFFDIELPFLRMEVIKFKKIICPEKIVEMELNWKPSSGKLYFQIESTDLTHSSGRMVYGEI